MGKTVYTTCEEIVEIIKANKIEKINLPELKKIIQKKAGYNDRTVKQYFRALKDFNFIQPSKFGMGIFELTNPGDNVEEKSEN